MGDIEDLKLECRDIPSASDRGSSSDDSDDSDSDSSSSRSSRGPAAGNKRRMRSRERQRKRAPPRKTCRHRSGSSSLERPPGNWRHRARSEDFHRRSKSRDSSPGRRSPRRHSPRRDSPRRCRRTPSLRYRRDRYDRRLPEDRHRFEPRDLGYGRPRSAPRRPRSDSPRRFRQRQTRDAPPPSDKPRRFGMKVMEEDRQVAARNPPLIISCSRRTDVPWGFLRQYMNGFEDGFMYIASGPRKNPVVRAVCVQPYNPQTGKGVMCISWWSKNYKKWIAAWQKPDSVLHRYPVHLFNFTVNSDNLALEPGVDTSLTERLGQLTFLVQTFGAHAVSPRFDPIVHYRNLVGGPVMDNTKDFETVVRHVGSLGVDHIVFSFCQAYPKSVRNMRQGGMELVTLNRAEQCAMLDKLMPVAHRYGVQMRCCGDKGLVGYPITKSDTEGLAAAAQREEQQMQSANFPVVGQSRCVDARLADRIAREKGLNVFMSLAKDLRQRKDCECTRSTDIGQYTLQCPHGCVYCYANPLVRRKGQAEPPQVTDQAPVISHQQLPPAPPPMIPHMPAAQCAPTGYMPPQYMPTGMPPVGVPGMPMPMPMAPPGHAAPAMTAAPPPPPPLPQPGANASELMMHAYKLNWPAGLMTYASAEPGEVLAKMACQARP